MNKIYLRLTGVLVFSFILGVVFQGCGATNSALPQSSIPLPTNDPVTISAPDASGFVVITAAADAVPASSTVVIQVGSGAASLDLNRLLHHFVKSAYAATCTSDLPQCPELDSDGKCQTSSSADGSFTVSVPAALNDQVTINYLDPTTCVETQSYTATVSSSIKALEVDAVSFVVSKNNNSIYLVGKDSNDTATLVRYDLSNGTTTSYQRDGFTGTVHKISLYTHFDAKDYLLIETSEALWMGAIQTDGSVNLDASVSLLDENENNMPNLKFLSGRQMTYSSTIDTCFSASIFPDSSQQRYSRLFFYNEGLIYILEFAETLSQVDSSYINADGDLILRNMSLSLGEVSGISTAATGVDVNQVNVFESVSDGTTDTLVMLVSFEQDTEKKLVLYRSLDSGDYCSSATLDFSAADQDKIELGKTAGVFSYGVDIIYYNDEEGFGNVLYLIKQEEQLMIIVNMDISNSQQCSVQDVIALAGETVTDPGNACLDIVNSNDSGDIIYTGAASDIYFSQFFSTSEGKNEVYILGNANGSSDFITSNNTTSSFKTDANPVNAIFPIGVDYDKTGNQLVVVDRGLTDDGKSNVIFYELGAMPYN